MCCDFFSLAAGLYGDIVGHSDFQMNLRPPGIGSPFIPSSQQQSEPCFTEEATHDVETSLQALLKVLCALRFFHGSAYVLLTLGCSLKKAKPRQPKPKQLRLSSAC